MPKEGERRLKNEKSGAAQSPSHGAGKASLARLKKEAISRNHEREHDGEASKSERAECKGDTKDGEDGEDGEDDSFCYDGDDRLRSAGRATKKKKGARLRICRSPSWRSHRDIYGSSPLLGFNAPSQLLPDSNIDAGRRCIGNIDTGWCCSSSYYGVGRKGPWKGGREKPLERRTRSSERTLCAHRVSRYGFYRPQPQGLDDVAGMLDALVKKRKQERWRRHDSQRLL